MEEKSSFSQFSSVLCRFFSVDFFLPEFFLYDVITECQLCSSPGTRGRLDHGRPAPSALRKQIVVQIIIYNRRKQLHHKNANNSRFSQGSLRISVPSIAAIYLHLGTGQIGVKFGVNFTCKCTVDARADHNCVPKRILSPLLNTQSQLW